MTLPWTESSFQKGSKKYENDKIQNVSKSKVSLS